MMSKKAELCQIIERRIGRKVVSSTDFVWLSEQIMERQHQTVGVNTLKRMWGYLGEGKVETRRATLDVLAQFAGYKDYATFCVAGDGDSSNTIVTRHLNTKTLEPGMMVRLEWLPDRVCVIEYLGNMRFVVREAEHSKLCVGATFLCPLIIEGEQLYLQDMEQNGNPPVNYIAGRHSGVRFEVIEK